MNLDFTEEHCSLGGDCHLRTTSAHFPATIGICKDAAELKVSVVPESGFLQCLLTSPASQLITILAGKPEQLADKTVPQHHVDS